MKHYAGLAALIAVCCVSLTACSSSDKPTAAQMPAPLVRIVTIKTENVPLVGDFVGQTAGSLSVQVRAQVGGILKKRNYTEGDFVKQGQILFEIDPDTYRAALDQAKGRQAQAAATLDGAKREWERILPLYKKNAVSQKDRDSAQSAYDGAKADFEAAQAAVTEAQIKLGYAYVVAPISGFASKESRSEGNLITTGGEESLLTEINQLDPLFVDFSIPSTEHQRLRRLLAEGRAEAAAVSTAEIRLADGAAYVHKGEVTFVDSKVNVDTSVIKARAVFPNPERIVLPGQFVRVSVFGMHLKDALLIPQSAMVQTQKGAIVMVLDDKDVPQVRPVTLAEGLGDNFVVEAGLKPGERIIVAGVNKIRPGQPVRIDTTPQDKAVAAAGVTRKFAASASDGTN